MLILNRQVLCDKYDLSKPKRKSPLKLEGNGLYARGYKTFIAPSHKFVFFEGNVGLGEVNIFKEIMNSDLPGTHVPALNPFRK
jgi:hypothetical protein